MEQLVFGTQIRIPGPPATQARRRQVQASRKRPGFYFNQFTVSVGASSPWARRQLVPSIQIVQCVGVGHVANGDSGQPCLGLQPIAKRHNFRSHRRARADNEPVGHG